MVSNEMETLNICYCSDSGKVKMLNSLVLKSPIDVAFHCRPIYVRR